MNVAKGWAWIALAFLGVGAACGAGTEETVVLWPNGAPGALGKEAKDIPTLTHFRTEASAHAVPALVICPGGAYAHLASHEGKGYAEWFSKQGIACFVLKYRLGSDGYRHPRMLEDAARAVRLVRARASEWGVDPGRIGIIGSSAGGHLAATLLTRFDEGRPEADDPIDRVSSRPDFGILCYPVITMASWTHAGSRNNLLGENPSKEQIEELSAELHVTERTPPCFLWHTGEDQGVPLENSLAFAGALRKAGVPFDLHLYQKGRHGIGLGNGHPWTADCLYWMKELGFVSR
jgi:acetyl esterase/lipase